MNTRRLLIHLTLLSVALLPAITLAQAPYSIQNPLKANSLQCLLFIIINGITAVLGIVAALYIIYSGFLFVSAQGNPEKIKKAKQAFLNALIGTAILLGAWAITSFIINVVNQVLARPVPGLPTSC